MLILKNVTKIFYNVTALLDVSFEIKAGDIVGFLGPNGAGKTTTMRILIGYLRPTRGEVYVGNFDPYADRMSVLPQIGYLPENNPLYTEMKVREYLRFITEIKKSHIKDEKNIIEEVDLGSVLHQSIENLSRGYKQRVGLAASLIGNPKILILDEPTSGLDPIEQEKIQELIKDLGRRRIIILSTHILSEVEAVANRVIIINKGSIVYDGEKPKIKGGVEQIFKKTVS